MPFKIAEIRAKTSHKTFSIKAAKGSDPKEAEVLLYADIGAGGFFSDGVSAKQFVDELNKIPSSVNRINVRINSPGGDVFDGMSIYNALKRRKEKIVVYVDGLAASIASVIMMAGEEIVMGEGALVMIHKPWTWAIGNADDLEAKANILDNIEEQMLAIYAKKSTLSKEELRDKLREETWMDADTAIEWGFANSKAEDQAQIAASILDRKWIKAAPRNAAQADANLRKAAAEMKAKIDAQLAKK